MVSRVAYLVAYAISALILIAAGGCVTPLVARPELLAVGLFHLQHAELTEDVRYDRLQGIGLAIGDSTLTLGAMTHERVLVNPTAQGMYVVTPRVAFMTGKVAETHGTDWLLVSYTGNQMADEYADWRDDARGVLVIEPGEVP